MTGLRLGGAFGDGLKRSLVGQEIAAFDGLGAPFWFDLGDFAGVAGGPSLQRQFRDLMGPTSVTQGIAARQLAFILGRGGSTADQDLDSPRLRLGLLETPGGADGGLLALAEDAVTFALDGGNGISVTAFTTYGIAGQSPALGTALTWRPSDIPIGFRVGWLAERETLLGTSAKGAFGGLSADAGFVGIEADFTAGAWRLTADAEIGTVAPGPRNGLMTDMSRLTTSAFALNATRRLTADGTMQISLSQPLRVEDGRAVLSIPVGRTQGGDVVRRPLEADLAPSGRQVDVTARWRQSLAVGGELRFGATWTRNPGHNADAEPALSFLVGWRYAF